MFQTMYYIGIITSIVIFLANFFVFAWVLKLIVNNYKKVLEYKKALLYSVVFTIFNIIWYYVGSYITDWNLLLYVIGSIIWWIAVLIFWKNLIKDDFTNFWIVIRVILANFLLLMILSFISAFIIWIFVNMYMF